MTVTLADPERVDDTGKRPVLRPRIQVRHHRAGAGAGRGDAVSPARPAQKARVVFVTPGDGRQTEVVLELSGGMGRGLTAPPGSVPEVGERLCLHHPVGRVPARRGPSPRPRRRRGRTAARHRTGNRPVNAGDTSKKSRSAFSNRASRPGDHSDADRAGQARNAAQPVDGVTGELRRERTGGSPAARRCRAAVPGPRDPMVWPAGSAAPRSGRRPAGPAASGGAAVAGAGRRRPTGGPR